MLLPNSQRQHRNVRVQEDVLPYALRPVSAALASIFRMDSISTSYSQEEEVSFTPQGLTREPL